MSFALATRMIWSCCSWAVSSGFRESFSNGEELDCPQDLAGQTDLIQACSGAGEDQQLCRLHHYNQTFRYTQQQSIYERQRDSPEQLALQLATTRLCLLSHIHSFWYTQHNTTHILQESSTMLHKRDPNIVGLPWRARLLDMLFLGRPLRLS